MKVNLLFEISIFYIFIFAEFSSVSSKSLNETLNSFAEAENSTNRKANPENGRLFFGLIDYSMTPSRWTRNFVKWLHDGLVFAGMWLQADTFVRALIQTRERIEKKAQIEKEAEEMKKMETLSKAVNSQTFNMTPSTLSLPSDSKQTHMEINETFKPEIEYKSLINFNNSKSYQKTGQKLDQQNSFKSRSGELDLESKLTNLFKEKCLRRAMCVLSMLSETSPLTYFQKMRKLRKSATFSFKEELGRNYKKKNCDLVSKLCKKTTNQIQLILY